MLLRQKSKQLWYISMLLRANGGRQERVEGEGGGRRGAEAGDVIECGDGLVEHAGGAVCENYGCDEGLLGGEGVAFAGLEKGFDVGEAAGGGEAADGEIYGEAGGGGIGGGVLEGGDYGDGGRGVELFEEEGFGCGWGEV